MIVLIQADVRSTRAELAIRAELATKIVLDDVANFVEREGNDLRDRYAQDSRLFGGFLLAFAGWPLLAAGVIIVVMALLVIGLFVAVFFPKLFATKQPAA